MRHDVSTIYLFIPLLAQRAQDKLQAGGSCKYTESAGNAAISSSHILVILYSSYSTQRSRSGPEQAIQATGSGAYVSGWLPYLFLEEPVCCCWRRSRSAVQENWDGAMGGPEGRWCVATGVCRA